jgi:hypothetical protein
VVALTAATAAVIALAVLLPIVLPRGGSRAAAAELRRFATIAARQRAQPLGASQYYYLKEVGRERITLVSMPHGSYSVFNQVEYEYWVREDGSGRFVYTPGKLSWPGPRDRARWEAEGSPRLFGPGDQVYGPGELIGPEPDGSGAFAALPAGYEFESLPRDPQDLYEVIREASGEWEPRAPGEPPHPSDVGAFGLSVELLHTPFTPSDVRSALFEAMAYIPGITVVSETSIPGIGTGAAVSHDANWGDVRVRILYLIDPLTAEILGEQLTLLDRAEWIDADPPFVMDWTAYGRPVIVDSTSERP